MAAAADREDKGHLLGFGDPSHKRSKLQEITEQRELDVASAKSTAPEASVQAAAEQTLADLGAPKSLLDRIAEAETTPWRLALCAEFKRASPSKGDINVALKADEQALAYAQVGAAVISVLTEPKWFKGSLTDLLQARRRTQSWAEEHGRPRPLVLRKDFIVDEYQVLEALAHGADTVLLMVSVLAVSRLRALLAYCRARGMEPLVEVANSKELAIAVDVGAAVIGVNNRDLHTLTLDADRTNRLGQELRGSLKVAFGPGTRVKLLALSGLASAADVEACRAVPCSGVLVGEALMRAADPAVAIEAMMGSAPAPAARAEVVVKVCGVTRGEDAKVALGAGANLIGVIFAKSKRTATPEQLSEIVAVVRRFGERDAPVPRPPTNGGGGASAELRSRSEALRSVSGRKPLVVGVFLDQPLEEVEAKARDAGVDVIQLHGEESIEFASSLRQRLPQVWLIKVLHLPPRDADSGLNSTLRAKAEAFAGVCDALLLDTAVPGAGAAGGTGQAFDWDLVSTVQGDWGLPVLVAGGLHGGNVAELVRSVAPLGVDVSSGVEAGTPGVKCPEKTTSYVQNAKRASQESPSDAKRACRT